MPQISNNIVNSKPCPNYIFFFFVFTEITSKIPNSLKSFHQILYRKLS